MYICIMCRHEKLVDPVVKRFFPPPATVSYTQYTQ